MAWPVLLMAYELDQGGSERQLTEIAKALDRSRFEPHVGCLRPDGLRARELKAAGVPIVHFRCGPWRRHPRCRVRGNWRDTFGIIRSAGSE
jgi:hypothetical protein